MLSINSRMLRFYLMLYIYCKSKSPTYIFCVALAEIINQLKHETHLIDFSRRDG